MPVALEWEVTKDAGNGTGEVEAGTSLAAGKVTLQVIAIPKEGGKAVEGSVADLNGFDFEIFDVAGTLPPALAPQQRCAVAIHCCGGALFRGSQALCCIEGPLAAPSGAPHLALHFPSSLTSYQRMFIHAMAEALAVPHESRGEGSDRHIVITFPLQQLLGESEASEEEEGEKEGRRR